MTLLSKNDNIIKGKEEDSVRLKSGKCISYLVHEMFHVVQAER